MNPEETQYYERHVKEQLNEHWRQVASKTFDEKREEIRRRIEKFEKMEDDFVSNKSITWVESMKYIERLKKL